jgi:hypothetical protein
MQKLELDRTNMQTLQAADAAQPSDTTLTALCALSLSLFQPPPHRCQFAHFRPCVYREFLKPYCCTKP